MIDLLLVDSIEFQKNCSTPQLGLLSLKNLLNKKYSVEVINFDYINYGLEARIYEDSIDKTLENLEKYILDKEPKIIGFYTICSSFQYSLLLAERIKNQRPLSYVIMGGPHATVLSEEILSDFPFVDAICQGESELQIVDFIGALLQGGFEKIPGAVYRLNGEVIKNKNSLLIPSDELKNYTVLDDEWYNTKRDEIVIEAGRGCPFACTFCSSSIFWGRRHRIKPVDDLINEMKYFGEKYGINIFSFHHDIFTANKKHLHRFCSRIIEEELPYNWICSSRLDVLDFETIELLAKANCESIFIGIESGSQSMQKKLNKNLNLQYGRQIIKCLIDNKIKITASFIYGFPHETLSEFKETVSMIEDLFIMKTYIVQYHLYFPLPKTPETDSIRDLLYFDESKIDTSIYRRGRINSKILDYIKNYPHLFLQYYTFNSEIRSRFIHIDLLVLIIFSFMDIYYHSIKILIETYGLIVLYERYERLIHKYSLDLRFKTQLDSRELDVSSYLDLIDEIRSHEFNSHFSIFYDELFSYENIICDYSLNNNKTEEIYSFDIDIVKAISLGIYKESQNMLKFSINNKKIKISKIRLKAS